MNYTKEVPLVSVCVQTYQHADYIEQCLENIIAQKTKFSFELIIGEDQSDDGTREICVKYANEYPTLIRLFLRRREDVIHINGTPTGRFNMLKNIESARGRYIALCEGDDYWTDEYKLQKQIDFLESNSDYSLCATNTMIFEEKTKKKRIHPIPFNKEFFTGFDLLTTFNFIKTVSVVFKNKDIRYEGDKWDIIPFGDLYLWLISSEKGKIKILNDITCEYRVHSKGAWNGKNIVTKEKNYYLFYKAIKEDFNYKYFNICRRKMIYHRKKIINAYISESKINKIFVPLISKCKMFLSKLKLL